MAELVVGADDTECKELKVGVVDVLGEKLFDEPDATEDAGS